MFFEGFGSDARLFSFGLPLLRFGVGVTDGPTVAWISSSVSSSFMASRASGLYCKLAESAKYESGQRLPVAIPGDRDVGETVPSERLPLCAEPGGMFRLNGSCCASLAVLPVLFHTIAGLNFVSGRFF